MPQQPSELRPWESPEALFGSELRHYRDAAGMTCVQLANLIPFSKSAISSCERGETRCGRALALEADRVLETHGILTRLWDKMFKGPGGVPTWFFDWYMHEKEYVTIRGYEPLVIPGLLQTPAYVRALLEDDEKRIETRLERQAILSRDDPPPPTLMCVIDESVLYRKIGGPEVMREQLEHLIAMSSPRFRIQIVPSIQHGGLSGPFGLGTLPDGKVIAYRDGVLRGETTAAGEDTSSLSEMFSQIQSHAYPMDQSAALIRKVADSKWT
ncbi:helix-turn-helix domain-containing protein [Actinomadura macrotermitis]|uniref:DUF5753 domain-containing protein n=1 Tax=Actinomadura macrotermitis TaxID=2585200 RepID=A0A7K0C0X1_9ACTN|nr:helix-turn-helix transcriptional regulator [Actinomadura macrotermitis]MQY06996.1 hypothetical protein [Actinomadura macrotermitis]